MYRRKTYRRKAPKRTYKRKSYAPKVPKLRMASVKKVVRQEIARNVENKTVQHFDYDQRLYAVNNVSFPTDNIWPVGLDPGSLIVNQGVTQSQRIGNVIKTKKLIFKGTLVPLPYESTLNPAPQPVQGTIWIFYDKKNPTELPNVQANNDWFQNGAASKGFQNDLTDNWSPVNTDRYRVVAKKHFKLGFASYNVNAPAAQFQYANNDFKLNVNFSFDLTKHYPKFVKFEDNSTVPTTRGLFCMITYALANGGTVPSAAYMVGAQWMLDYQFEDA